MFVNLSWRVWTIFCFNVKIFFWSYTLSPYLPLQIFLSNVSTKKPSIWFVILAGGIRNFSPHPTHSEQVCSIVWGLLFSFPEKSAQGSTWLCLQDNCGPYFCHFLKLSLMNNCNYWGWVKMVDMALKIGICF